MAINFKCERCGSIFSKERLDKKTDDICDDCKSELKDEADEAEYQDWIQRQQLDSIYECGDK